MADLVIGAYYERADRSIALTTGWDARARALRYRLDDGLGERTATTAEAGSWTLRRDLADFPDSRDPVLPPGFDLVWDAKRRSDLPPLLADPEIAGDVEAALRKHGIALTGDEAAEVERLRETARLARF